MDEEQLVVPGQEQETTSGAEPAGKALSVTGAIDGIEAAEEAKDAASLAAHPEAQPLAAAAEATLEEQEGGSAAVGVTASIEEPDDAAQDVQPKQPRESQLRRIVRAGHRKQKREVLAHRRKEHNELHDHVDDMVTLHLRSKNFKVALSVCKRSMPLAVAEWLIQDAGIEPGLLSDLQASENYSEDNPNDQDVDARITRVIGLGKVVEEAAGASAEDAEGLEERLGHALWGFKNLLPKDTTYSVLHEMGLHDDGIYGAIAKPAEALEALTEDLSRAERAGVMAAIDDVVRVGLILKAVTSWKESLQQQEEDAKRAAAAAAEAADNAIEVLNFSMEVSGLSLESIRATPDTHTSFKEAVSNTVVAGLDGKVVKAMAAGQAQEAAAGPEVGEDELKIAATKVTVSDKASKDGKGIDIKARLEIPHGFDGAQVKDNLMAVSQSCGEALRTTLSELDSVKTVSLDVRDHRFDLLTKGDEKIREKAAEEARQKAEAAKQAAIEAAAAAKQAAEERARAAAERAAARTEAREAVNALGPAEDELEAAKQALADATTPEQIAEAQPRIQEAQASLDATVEKARQGLDASQQGDSNIRAAEDVKTEAVQAAEAAVVEQQAAMSDAGASPLEVAKATAERVADAGKPLDETIKAAAAAAGRAAGDAGQPLEEAAEAAAAAAAAAGGDDEQVSRMATYGLVCGFVVQVFHATKPAVEAALLEKGAAAADARPVEALDNAEEVTADARPVEALDNAEEVEQAEDGALDENVSPPAEKESDGDVVQWLFGAEYDATDLSKFRDELLAFIVGCGLSPQLSEQIDVTLRMGDGILAELRGPPEALSILRDVDLSACAVLGYKAYAPKHDVVVDDGSGAQAAAIAEPAEEPDGEPACEEEAADELPEDHPMSEGNSCCTVS
eukprot:TRINITY_DN7355_c0_g1_i3.p1 TRINITY_DN7355_c0_g1~~TRINITY_DN7355_c0_g1_i3.p1  ORF type:complete len:906 (-),score=297.46 TRINITY_DN7355_c0_g1_i3:208-2925(-)